MTRAAKPTPAKPVKPFEAWLVSEENGKPYAVWWCAAALVREYIREKQHDDGETLRMTRVTVTPVRSKP